VFRSDKSWVKTYQNRLNGSVTYPLIMKTGGSDVDKESYVLLGLATAETLTRGRGVIPC
jgi:hypothetical protein